MTSLDCMELRNSLLTEFSLLAPSSKCCLSLFSCFTGKVLGFQIKHKTRLLEWHSQEEKLFYCLNPFCIMQSYKPSMNVDVNDVLPKYRSQIELGLLKIQKDKK